MDKTETQILKRLKYVLLLADKYDFDLVLNDDRFELKATKPGIHFKTYCFQPGTTIADIGAFLRGYDAASMNHG